MIKDQCIIYFDIEWPDFPLIKGNVKKSVEVSMNWCGDDSYNNDYKFKFDYGLNNTE